MSSGCFALWGLMIERRVFMSYEKETRKVISRWDGLELDLLVLVPEETPKGIFQIHHGMSEYKER